MKKILLLFMAIPFIGWTQVKNTTSTEFTNGLIIPTKTTAPFLKKWSLWGDETTNRFRYYDGTVWQNITTDGSGDARYILNQTTAQSGSFHITGTGKITGAFGIGTLSTPGASVGFLNRIGLTGSTTAYGNYTLSNIASDVTVKAYGQRIVLGMDAGSYTVPEINQFSAGQTTFGAGASATLQVGYNVEATLIGGVSNRGFRSQIPSGTNRYNLYIDGTAQNYIEGKLALGGTLPSALLQIKGGTTAAGTAPIKLTSGPLMIAPEIGAIEFLTDRLYFTQTTTATRQQLAYLTDLTAGYVPTSRTLTAGYGINTLGNLSADRTVSVDSTSAGGVVSKSRLNTLNASLVHKSGVETITGIKTVSSVLRLDSGVVYVKPVTIIPAPATGYNSLNFTTEGIYYRMNDIDKTLQLTVSSTAGSAAQFQDGVGVVAWTKDLPIAGSYSGVGTATTTFTVTIGQTMANTTYKVNVTPTSLLGAAAYYVTNKTVTTFDVVYLSGLTGTLTLDWSVFK